MEAFHGRITWEMWKSAYSYSKNKNKLVVFMPKKEMFSIIKKKKKSLSSRCREAKMGKNKTKQKSKRYIYLVSHFPCY